MHTTEINGNKNNSLETNLSGNNETELTKTIKLNKLKKLLTPVKAFFKWFFPTKKLIKKNPEQIIRNATINPFYQGRDKKRQGPVGQPGLPSSRFISSNVWNSTDNNILQEIQEL